MCVLLVSAVIKLGKKKKKKKKIYIYVCVSGFNSEKKKIGMDGWHNTLFCRNILYRN